MVDETRAKSTSIYANELGGSLQMVNSLFHFLYIRVDNEFSWDNERLNSIFYYRDTDDKLTIRF